MKLTAKLLNSEGVPGTQKHISIFNFLPNDVLLIGISKRPATMTPLHYEWVPRGTRVFLVFSFVLVSSLFPFVDTVGVITRRL